MAPASWHNRCIVPIYRQVEAPYGAPVREREPAVAPSTQVEQSATAEGPATADSSSVIGRAESLGVVPVALLALLADGPRHGYELRTMLGHLLSCEARSSAVSFGSLYPALSRLEADGLIECESHARPLPIPATGSLTGERAAMRAGEEHHRSGDAATSRGRQARNRRVYRLTALGGARLGEALGDPSAACDDRAFSLRLVLASRISEHDRQSLLDNRERALQERLERLGGRVGNEAGGGRDGWSGAGRDRAVALLKAELSWLSKLRHERREGD